MTSTVDVPVTTSAFSQISLRRKLANTTATVYVPTADARSVTESGAPAATAAGVKFLRMEGGAAVFEVASGDYHFVSALAM